MGSESQMWRTLRPAMLSLDPVRIECKVDEGVPDVNYLTGWLELKYADCPATDPQYIPRLPHFTPEQRRWLSRRWKAGGLVWLMLRTEGEWLLFDGYSAAILGSAPLYALRMRAAARWEDTPESQELCSWLSGAPLSPLHLIRLRRCLDSFAVDRAMGLRPGQIAEMETTAFPEPLRRRLERFYG